MVFSITRRNCFMKYLKSQNRYIVKSYGSDTHTRLKKSGLRVLNLSSSSSHVMERESLCDQDILCWYPEISISESSSGDSVYRQYGDLSRRTVTNAEDEASVSVTGVTFTMLCMLTAARRCCTS